MRIPRPQPPAALLAAVLAALATAGCGKSSGSGHSVVLAPSARGPFLAETTTSSIVIAWSTELPGVGEVEYGQDQSYGSRTIEDGPRTAHAVTLQGLLPGTRYFYRVHTAGVFVATGRFDTFPEAQDPFLRFVAFGDCGAGTIEQLQVAELIRDADPDLAILTGDIIYEVGHPVEFDPKYFEPYADLIDHIPFFPSLGNHDVMTANGQPYLDAFHLPHNNPLQTERYYSFDPAHVHFIALDSNQSAAAGSPMRDWLTADLQSAAAVSAVWRFVYFHHPPFSSALHQSDLTLREQIEDLLAAAGVDIVFNGHDHTYERTFPLLDSAPVNKDEEPNYTNPGGVVYIVTGGGGRALYERTQFTNAFTARFESVHHLVRVDVSGPSLTLTAIDINGMPFDEMTLSK